MTTLSRFKGCMLGGALGDALGFPLATHHKDRMFRTLAGASAHGVPEHLPIVSGETALVSSKTQMTLFTAEGLVRAVHRGVSRGICSPVAVLLRAYQRWLATQDAFYATPWAEPAERGWLLDMRELHIDRKASRACVAALESTVRRQICPSASDPPNAHKGAEALVRSAPIGLVAETAAAAFELAAKAAVLTNGDRTAYQSAGCFAAMIWYAARGAALEDAVDDALLLVPERDAQEILSLASIARSVASHGAPSRETIERLGRGDTALEALAIAIICARSFRMPHAPEEVDEAVRACLWRAAAHGGASDTIASLTGSLLGAKHGVEALPQQWLAELELRDVIEQLACDLHATCVREELPDPVRYPPN